MNVGIIDAGIKKYEKIYSREDQVLQSVFKAYKGNDSLEAVIAKVCVLNTLYSTRVVKNQIIGLAEHIYSIPELDKKIKAGRIEAFYDISNTTNGINKVPVFASKYCHFHNPIQYPIFDSYSRLALVSINQEYRFAEVFSENSITDYKVYKERLDQFLGSLNKKYDYKKIDEFLWIYGKSLKEEHSSEG